MFHTLGNDVFTRTIDIMSAWDVLLKKHHHKIPFKSHDDQLFILGLDVFILTSDL